MTLLDDPFSPRYIDIQRLNDGLLLVLCIQSAGGMCYMYIAHLLFEQVYYRDVLLQLYFHVFVLCGIAGLFFVCWSFKFCIANL